jgi:hypothetical protein
MASPEGNVADRVTRTTTSAEIDAMAAELGAAERPSLATHTPCGLEHGEFRDPKVVM